MYVCCWENKLNQSRMFNLSVALVLLLLLLFVFPPKFKLILNLIKKKSERKIYLYLIPTKITGNKL
jgi:hypothetical protein